MTLLGDLLFNLMLNAVASFWLGLAVLALIWCIARPTRPGIAALVLLLPAAKLLWDLRSGVPAESFFWASERGIRQRLGAFQIGVGANYWGLIIAGQLSALHAGGRSPQSFADVLSRALRFRVSVYAASLLSFGALAVALIQCGARGLGLVVFRRRIRALLRTPTRIERRAIGRRSVRVHLHRAYQGVPFAGGILRPYVVLPALLAEQLSQTELEAVIQHELGHIRYFDLALLLPLGFLCDLFWFVPGMSWLFSSQRRLLEERADDCAISAGVSPESVASALVRVAELTRSEACAPLLAMSREPSTLRLRVRRLLAPRRTGAPQPWLTLGRALLVIWLVLGALQSTACGNHP